MSRAGHIKIAAALAGIDFKGLVFAVALIKLDIEIGKAGEMDAFEKILEFLHQLFFVFRDNDRMVADAIRRMFLQQYVSEAHHLDLAVAVGVAC